MLGAQFAVLRWLGVFSPGVPWAANVYRAAVFTLVSTVAGLMTVQIFAAADLIGLARTVDIWTLLLSALYKWSYMVARSGEFAELNAALSRMRGTGAGADRIAGRSRLLRRSAVWYMALGATASLTNIVAPLLTYPKGNRSDLEYYNDPKSYPLSCWLPFVVDGRWTFCAVYACHSAAVIVVIVTYMATDSYFFGAVYAIGGQITLLNSALDSSVQNALRTDDAAENSSAEKLSNDNVCTLYTEAQQTRHCSIIRECVAHHVMILDYIKNIRELFSSLIIVDYLHGIISLTFALFQITISPVGSVETISMVCFVVLSVGHQFLNNFFGEYIIQKQLSVASVSYDVPWWRTGKKIRSYLRIMTLRSNRPTVISGFYMYKLSYQSFINFIKALYTYYMVLRHVNVEKKLV